MLHRALLAALALVLALPAAAPAREGSWHRPLAAGEVAATFAFDPATPYARGQRRGLDVRGSPGAPVVAACAGRVTYAGRIPGDAPARRLGVSIRCGGLVATELGLAAVTVRAGAPVAAGLPVGRLGPAGVLRLGARRAGVRHGYVDPAGLLRGGAAPPTLAPAPRSRPPRRPGAPVPARTPARRPSAADVRALPPLAWAGVALLVASGAGGATTARRRRHARLRTATAGR